MSILKLKISLSLRRVKKAKSKIKQQQKSPILPPKKQQHIKLNDEFVKSQSYN